MHFAEFVINVSCIKLKILLSLNVSECVGVVFVLKVKWCSNDALLRDCVQYSWYLFLFPGHLSTPFWGCQFHDQHYLFIVRFFVLLLVED